MEATSNICVIRANVMKCRPCCRLAEDRKQQVDFKELTSKSERSCWGKCLTLALFAVGLIFMIHGTDDHLEDAVDCAAVEPDIQGSDHQPFNGCLLNTGQCLLITQGNVLRAYAQNNFETCLKYTWNLKFNNTKTHHRKIRNNQYYKLLNFSNSFSSRFQTRISGYPEIKTQDIKK